MVASTGFKTLIDGSRLAVLKDLFVPTDEGNRRGLIGECEHGPEVLAA